MSPQTNGTDDLTPRTTVLSAQVAMIVQGSIGVASVGIILVLSLIALKEKWATLQVRRRSDRTIFYVVGLSLVTFMYYIVELLMFARDWTDNPNGCFRLGRGPLSPFLYTVAKQLLYLLLFERACLVLDTLRIRELFYNILRYGTLVSITIGVR